MKTSIKLLDFHCKYKSTTTAKYWIQKPKGKRKSIMGHCDLAYKPIAPHVTP